MLVEIGLEGEGFAASLARERLQIGMSLDVGAQIRLVGESFFTDLAGERLLSFKRRQSVSFGDSNANPIYKFTCVRSNVALQQPRPGEGFAAVRTLAALTVGADVHRESRYRHVDFVAMRATSRLN